MQVRHLPLPSPIEFKWKFIPQNVIREIATGPEYLSPNL